MLSIEELKAIRKSFKDTLDGFLSCLGCGGKIEGDDAVIDNAKSSIAKIDQLIESLKP